MTDRLTEHLQNSRLTVIAVDRALHRVRVRGVADACAELTCVKQTLVLAAERRGGQNPACQWPRRHDHRAAPGVGRDRQS